MIIVRCDLILTNHRQYFVLLTVTYHQQSVHPAPFTHQLFSQAHSVTWAWICPVPNNIKAIRKHVKERLPCLLSTSFYNPPFCLCYFSCSALWIHLWGVIRRKHWQLMKGKKTNSMHMYTLEMCTFQWKFLFKLINKKQLPNSKLCFVFCSPDRLLQSICHY